ncbi:hypothetical protein BDU57DRAFT_515126 [Ampelomyces quisqualis]|uniref:Uncharacterized protein n=1 Tax=Ampelomyces quisqualis TaxID=50730 RepID=A0A6A5QU46_AMPQU|nr:hypothetical protein BDU57DRAFT_515126 [Ampelomyces quisqualis]
MSDSTIECSQDLKYPPVQISRSLEKLDLDALIMRSTSRRPQQEAGSSLEDSAFEFLGDSLLETSDDEAHTESIASTDGYTPDNASNFSDDDIDYGTDTGVMQHSTASLLFAASDQQQQAARSIHSTDDSTLTEGPTLVGDSSHTIRLEEQPGQDDGVSQGSKVTRTFPDEDGTRYPILEQYQSSEVRVVLKAALSNLSVPTPDSYNILYVGEPDKWNEDIMTAKISAALMAGPSTSRSIMVQGQMEPYGPIMHVDHCIEIRILPAEKGSPRIALSLSNGKEVVLGHGHPLSSETRPDLVVFCQPSTPDPSEIASTYPYIRQLLASEQVPFLEITSTRNYGKGALSYDSRSLRVCMEGRDDAEAEFDLKEVLPIDLYTFSELESSQINRHLALISPHLLTANEKGARAVQGGKTWTWKQYAEQLGSAQRSKVTLLAVLALISAMILGPLYSPILVPMLRGGTSIEADRIKSEPLLELCSTRSIPLETPATISVPTLSVASTQRSLTVVPPQVNPPKQAKKAEKLVHFEIEPTNAHQFKLVPNKEMLNARKKPQLQIEVWRQAQTVSVRYNRTINGVYVVDLEQQYPFGSFNVSIASYSKPLLQQTFQIALGHNKTMIDQFFDLTKTNLANTQSSLSNLSASAAQGLSASLSELDVTARHVSNEIRHTAPYLKARLQSAKEVMAHRLGARAGVAARVPEAVWAGVQEATAPIRRSSYLSKLRMRAIWARCQTERASGLSSSEGTNQESWACAKMRGEA